MIRNRGLLFAIFLIAGLLVGGLFNACSVTTGTNNDSTVNQQKAASFYFSSMTRLNVEVVYEADAEPYVGTTVQGKNYWDFLEDNLKAIFQGRTMTFSVPKTLAQMRQISAQNRLLWSPQDALDLARRERLGGENDGATGKFFIAFVKGNASENGVANPNVIGYSVTGTTVMIMFKDVIRSTGSTPAAVVPKYVEQSTLIHEMGHALGFVNNGLPMTTAHQDTAHGAHCSNPDCVMYYLNEGGSDLAQFVQKYITSGSTVMMGPECLQDSQSYHP